MSLLTLIVAGSLAAPLGTWVEEFDRGLALAREQGKDVLVDFTGSDWCGWCKKLEAEVLRQPEFLEGVAEQYVLVRVDLPRSPEALAGVPDIARNRGLAREYRVQSFPTVLLMTADEEVYGRTGYEEGGAAAYLAHLGALRREGREPLLKARALASEFAAAAPESREAVAARAVTLFGELPDGNPGVAHLVPVLDHYLVSDPRNERGALAPALRLLLGSTQATPAQIARGRELDPRNELGLLELAVFAEAYWAADEPRQRAAATAIVALHRLGPIRDERAQKVLYTYGALWTATLLRDLPTAKQLARLGLPHARGNRGLEAQLQAILRK